MSRERRGALVVVGALAVVVLLRAAVFTTVRQGTAGMEPALRRGDVLLVSRLAAVEVGDIALVRFPGDDGPVLKRVVAQGPAEVSYGDEGLVVDGRPARTGMRAPATVVRQDCQELVVEAHVEKLGSQDVLTLAGGPAEAGSLPPGALWLLGDNRAGSSDARHWGSVRESGVEGVVVARLWSGTACP